jgi:hypothetical protein
MYTDRNIEENMARRGGETLKTVGLRQCAKRRITIRRQAGVASGAACSNNRGKATGEKRSSSLVTTAVPSCFRIRNAHRDGQRRRRISVALGCNVVARRYIMEETWARHGVSKAKAGRK